MDQSLFEVTVASIFHDIGKVLHRTPIDGRAHPKSGREFMQNYTDNKEILEAISYHHKGKLINANLSEDSVAYITYIADNVAAGIDRRGAEEIEGEYEAGKAKTVFERHVPLDTVFNILCNNNGNKALKLNNILEINFPKDRDKIVLNESHYVDCYHKLKEGLEGIEISPEYINSILELMETHLVYIPSSTNVNEVPDISLYDHLKITAAVASCIYLYLAESNRTNFKQELLDREEEFLDEKSMLMFSCDISGIQKFIYTITTEGALKALRSRSFYLEIILEHFVDCLISRLNLTRANVIYTGGGHAYILLPNTEEAKSEVKQAVENINKWFIKNVGISLYLAGDYVECSCNDLMNRDSNKYQNVACDDGAYARIFKELFIKLSYAKQRRYSAEDIITLNSRSKDTGGRECKVCGSFDLKTEENRCNLCQSLHNVSSDLLKEDTLIVTTKDEIKGLFRNVPIPSIDKVNHYMYILDKTRTKEILKEEPDKVISVYGRNKVYTGLNYARNLWSGTYHYKVENSTKFSELKDLAEKSKGIKRLAVLRADVDNLGAAFVSGFIRENEVDKEMRNKYQTISRTATLSRRMSLFFKYYINLILANSVDEVEPFSLDYNVNAEDEEGHKVAIVYSGGDDLFILGAWNEVIEAGVKLRRAFEKFSAGALTFSAGVGIFPEKFPVSQMAILTQDLEDAAKSIDDEKNAISLFGFETVNKNGKYRTSAPHTYKWDVFTDRVVGEKLRLLQRFLSQEDTNKGNSFVYKLMSYIRSIDDEDKESRINIARIAYLLGRIMPKSESGDKYKELNYLYKDFSKKIYDWIFNEDDRRELLTAIQIYVYLNRENETGEMKQGK